MSEPRTIPVVEPVGKIRFISTKSLYEHVKKHLLDGRDERWSQLIDADKLAEARREFDEDRASKPMLLEISRDYYRMISESMMRLTREGKQHRHLYWERPRISEDGKRIVVPEGLPNGAGQTIQAWELEKKILIFARAFVRNGRFLPYVLCSAYRPFPKLSGNSLRKNMERRQRERKFSCRDIVLAEHNE